MKAWFLRTVQIFVFLLLLIAAGLTTVSFVTWSIEPFQMVMQHEEGTWVMVRGLLVFSAFASFVYQAEGVEP